ncbi:hypothetical protein OHA18_33130 [Kribbella sp. NBC_00709]|uniref:hypothetical protein n=1 Tax=Kribbella sp. NBC_00709 TaxID=2975972 RepID=UPI002E2C57E7|nr:hypothetical protein [Kribbella sp. NBC_00709]
MNGRSTSGPSRDPFAQIWAAYGDQLRWIAETILGNRVLAQVLVVDVIATRSANPLASGGQFPSRHELARMTYLRCVRAGAVGDRVLVRQQRAAVALVDLGDHSSGDVADLFGLPAEAVAELLVAGRRIVGPAPAPGHEPGPGLVELAALLAHE